MKLEEMKKKFVDRRTGIIHEIKEHEVITGTIPMHIFTANKRDLVDTELNILIPVVSNGLGYDFSDSDKALEKAIGEAVERYCSATLNKPILKAKAQELDYTLDLYSITRCLSNQLTNEDLIYKKVSDELDLYWVQGKNELTGQETWIPTDLVYLGNFFNAKVIRDITSTGLAAGSTLDDAVKNGLLECIERDAFVIMWLNRLSMPQINIESINNDKIIRAISQIRSMELDITILDITNDLRVASFLTIIRSNKAPYITMGASTDLDPEKAIFDSILESSCCYNLNVTKYLDVNYSKIVNNHLSTFTNFNHHSDLYAFHENWDVVDFLFQGKVVDLYRDDVVYITEKEECLQYIQELGIDLYTVDITTNDVRKEGLFVIRTVMPQLAFLEVRHPMLDCQRINNVPVKLGYNTENLNQHPHPFP